jgi:hypothetical protein
MKYAVYDNGTGAITGFYDSTIHLSIPTPSISLSDADWLDAVNNPGKYQVNTTTHILELTPAPSGATLLQNAKDAKNAELAVNYQQDLINGFSSSALGSAHDYTNDASALATLNALIAAGSAADYLHYDSGIPTLVSHTLLQLEQVRDDFITDRHTAMSNYATKVAAVNAATTVIDVNAITY